MKTTHPLSLTFSLSLLGALTLSASSAHAQVLAYEYRFNDTGTTTEGTGSYTTDGTLRNSANSATDLHGAAGSGVSGLPGDLAFDNTGSTAFAGSGGGVSVPNTVGALDSMTSFTLSGWYKISADTGAYGNSALYYKNTSSDGNTGGRIQLLSERNALGESRLRFVLDENTFVNSSYDTTLGLEDEWVFFAVTYDGSISEDNLNFYVGTTTSDVELITTATLDLGVTGAANSSTMWFGNNSSRAAAFDGFLDNFRIHRNEAGIGNEATGALSQAQLNALRQVDAIPEPSTVLLTAPLLGAWLAFRRRNR